MLSQNVGEQSAVDPESYHIKAAASGNHVIITTIIIIIIIILRGGAVG
jgi:hypothetical protein